MDWLACGESFSEVIREENFLALMGIVFGCMTAMVAIVSGAITSVSRNRARELTKRELAAYVAEGSLEPDQAVAMIKAGTPKWEGGCKI